MPTAGSQRAFDGGAQAESGYTKIKSNIRRIEVTLKAGVKDVGKLGAENQIAVAV